MKKLILGFVLGIVLTAFAYNVEANPYTESWHVEKWCTEQGGEIEHVLPDRTRVDCLTDTHAIEFDWGKKWAEAIGQSLYYSYMTNKKAGIVLIVDEGKEDRFIKRLETVTNHQCIDVWIMPRVRE